jgi:hypothetical protein
VAWVQFSGVTPDAPPSTLPPLLTWSNSQGLGSGPSNANFSSTLSLKKDGAVQFSGTWNDTGSIPFFQSPARNFSVQYAVVASNNKVFTFSQTGTVPTASSQPWNVTSQNDQIKQNWAALATGAYMKGLASDASNVGSTLNSFCKLSSRSLKK